MRAVLLHIFHLSVNHDLNLSLLVSSQPSDKFKVLVNERLTEALRFQSLPALKKCVIYSFAEWASYREVANVRLDFIKRILSLYEEREESNPGKQMRLRVQYSLYRLLIVPQFSGTGALCMYMHV